MMPRRDTQRSREGIWVEHNMHQRASLGNIGRRGGGDRWTPDPFQAPPAFTRDRNVGGLYEGHLRVRGRSYSGFSSCSPKRGLLINVPEHELVFMLSCLCFHVSLRTVTQHGNPQCDRDLEGSSRGCQGFPGMQGCHGGCRVSSGFRIGIERAWFPYSIHTCLFTVEDVVATHRRSLCGSNAMLVMGCFS